MPALTPGEDNMPNPTPLSTITDEQISSDLLALVHRRGTGSSACPSEVVRNLSPNGWRLLMPRVKQVAVQLAQAGLICITQKGVVLNPAEPWRGPIRIRLPTPAQHPE